MTPAKAIKLECKWCGGSVRSFKCDSDICKLNDKSLTPLKRIKAHCLDCVETRQEVKVCSGKLLFENRLCYLHSYRFGKNPETNRDTSHLDRFKFSKKHAVIV